MAYVLMKLFGKIIALLPQGLSHRMGNVLGALSWYLVPSRRKRMAVQNVMLSLHQDETSAYRIAKRSWTRFGRMLTTMMQYPKMRKGINRYVSIEGRAHLDEALSYGRGVVIATAHSGNWELMGGALTLNGYPLIAVAKKQNNLQMDRLINEYRALLKIGVTYKTGVREMVRLLGQGKIVGLLMDQDAGKDGIILDFFGRKAAWVQGPAFLAHLKNAPIVTCFMVENPDGSHRLLLGKPLWTAQTENKHQDIEAMTETLAKIIEDHIRKYPEEWFWLHDRWKYANRHGMNG